MKLCIIRHGETDWNVLGKMQGREDIPLNDNGRFQAKQCGLLLCNGDWKRIVTSPLIRARETADIISNILNINEEICEIAELIERDYGEASGLTYSEYSNLYKNKDYEGAEEKQILSERIYKALIQIAEDFYPNDVIIISHGSAIKAVLEKLTNSKNPEHLKNACINLLEYRNQSFNVVYCNKSVEDLQA